MKRFKKRTAANCIGSFHWDDCVGCNSFLECARKDEDFDAECWCPYCHWMGSWGDCGVKVIRATQYDPEERWPLCPECGKAVEDTKND